MIAPTPLKAILKFCTTNKLFKFLYHGKMRKKGWQKSSSLNSMQLYTISTAPVPRHPIIPVLNYERIKNGKSLISHLL